LKHHSDFSSAYFSSMECAAESHSPDANPEADSALQRAHSSSSAVKRALQLIQLDDSDCRLEAAREIRRLTKSSQRCRRQLAQAVNPLVAMLRAGSPDSHEAALLALLNLAVKDEQ
jgi:hypothetical protein